MKPSILSCAALLAVAPSLLAAAEVTKGHRPSDFGFKLDPVLPPAINDAAAKATFSIIDGEKDGNSPDLAVLKDGKVPTGEDQPAANFFFGGDGGRIGVDLGDVISVKSVASYSWHGENRGPQVYKLYAADGKAEGFNATPKKGTDPKSVGWTLLAEVDTRPRTGNGGGQHGAEIANRGGKPLGDYRHLLFDVSKTSERGFANTFFSEIDVIDAKQSDLQRIKPIEKIVKNYRSKDGKFRYTIDSTKAPALTEWSEKELLPVIEEWYPKLVAMMPSDGYRAPDQVLFEYRDDMGGTPAYAIGNRIALSAPWYKGQLTNEAKGCAVHEMGHVVQNYWRARQTNRNPKDTPGWVTEGICDYIRWFLYEPQSRGAHVRDVRQAKYDASYRTTANFLDWVIKEKDKDLLKKLNAAAREGRYEEKLWKDWTGLTVQELGEEWKKAVADGKR
ncbi:basic secretory family protein [Luteolibacter flavescens]|uniref:Basic secretory family protein n=1 Tax=Luteolibacter flavescens TaxID=1859460 RepID=A0ABT3FJ03_9BACT|nr:basic secretory family protein [Luteolibacter flavescens]MCW1883546.1 basic secretory family protein [Luteolibacter flavescens]